MIFFQGPLAAEKIHHCCSFVKKRCPAATIAAASIRLAEAAALPLHLYMGRLMIGPLITGHLLFFLCKCSSGPLESKMGMGQTSNHAYCTILGNAPLRRKNVASQNAAQQHIRWCDVMRELKYFLFFSGLDQFKQRKDHNCRIYNRKIHY